LLSFRRRIALRDADSVPPTLILTRKDLCQVVNLPVLLRELKDALAGASAEGSAQRVRAEPSETVTAMVLVPGTAPNVPAYTVKVHAKNPDRRPALTGVICLHDSSSGDLLAVLDSGWLTALRTGAGAALGAHVLAGPEADAVGVIGAGQQGVAQLRALHALRPLASVHVHDMDPAAAAALAELARGELAVPDVQVCRSPAEVADVSDVLLIATWSRVPVLYADQVRPGTHITSLGADEPGKAELDARQLADALLVTDDVKLASAVLPAQDIDTTLGAVLRGEHPGRRTPQEITVYSPVGLPLQDCVAAWHAYRAALDSGLGTRLHLEA